MPDVSSTTVLGVTQRGYRRGALTTDPWDVYVVYTTPKVITYFGRACTFRVPGNAATTQTLATIYNATGSAVLVDVPSIRVMTSYTAGQLGTVQKAVLRAHRFTVLPTNGDAIQKVPLDSALTSSASVGLLQGASAHRTASTLALTATLPANTVMDEFQPTRNVGTTGAGVELLAIMTLLGNATVTLRAGEGLAVVLDDAGSAAANPVTDYYTVTIEWTEYTTP